MSSISARRSDAIRQRRAKRVRKPLEKQRRDQKGVYTPSSSPPVMARKTMVASGQVHEKRSSKTRLRVDLPLNKQGAEMRLPAIRNIRFGWRLVSFVMGLLLFYCLYSFWNSPSYRVDTVEIVGLHLLDSGVVGSIVDAEGQPIYTVDSMEIEQELLGTFPEFADVDIQVLLPNSVTVTVTERVPVLLWRQEGRTNLVDKEGMTFPVRDENATFSYPVVEANSAPPSPLISTLVDSDEDSGSVDGDELSLVSSNAREAKPFMTQAMVSAVLSLVEMAPDGATLTYDAHHGLGWNDPRGWVVYFGEFSYMDVKLEVYDAIINLLKKQDTPPTLISVEYLNAPYYRLTE